MLQSFVFCHEPHQGNITVEEHEDLKVSNHHCSSLADLEGKSVARVVCICCWRECEKSRFSFAAGDDEDEESEAVDREGVDVEFEEVFGDDTDD